MGLVSNVASSVSGKVDKALLCIKKPAAAAINMNMDKMASELGISLTANQKKSRTAMGGAIANVDLRAKMIRENKGFLNGFSTMKGIANQSGYHVMEVKYNPSRIRLNSHGGNQLMQGPGGAGANMQVQSTVPAMTTMQVELLFDDTNPQDAFMMEKFSNTSAGAVVSDIAGAVKTIRGEGYTVQHQIEGLLSLIIQSETRQVVFYWGDMAYAGEVTNIEARYTMFNPMGHPIRGKVNLSIREGGPDDDASGEEYWKNAYNELKKGQSQLFGKLSSAAGNIINLK